MEFKEKPGWQNKECIYHDDADQTVYNDHQYGVEHINHDAGYHIHRKHGDRKTEMERLEFESTSLTSVFSNSSESEEVEDLLVRFIQSHY